MPERLWQSLFKKYNQVREATRWQRGRGGAHGNYTREEKEIVVESGGIREAGARRGTRLEGDGRGNTATMDSDAGHARESNVPTDFNDANRETYARFTRSYGAEEENHRTILVLTLSEAHYVACFILINSIICGTSIGRGF